MPYAPVIESFTASCGTQSSEHIQVAHGATVQLAWRVRGALSGPVELDVNDSSSEMEPGATSFSATVNEQTQFTLRARNESYVAERQVQVSLQPPGVVSAPATVPAAVDGGTVHTHEGGGGFEGVFSSPFELEIPEHPHLLYTGQWGSIKVQLVIEVAPEFNLGEATRSASAPEESDTGGGAGVECELSHDTVGDALGAHYTGQLGPDSMRLTWTREAQCYCEFSQDETGRHLKVGVRGSGHVTHTLANGVAGESGFELDISAIQVRIPTAGHMPTDLPHVLALLRVGTTELTLEPISVDVPLGQWMYDRSTGSDQALALPLRGLHATLGLTIHFIFEPHWLYIVQQVWQRFSSSATTAADDAAAGVGDSAAAGAGDTAAAGAGDTAAAGAGDTAAAGAGDAAAVGAGDAAAVGAGDAAAVGAGDAAAVAVGEGVLAGVAGAVFTSLAVVAIEIFIGVAIQGALAKIAASDAVTSLTRPELLRRRTAFARGVLTKLTNSAAPIKSSDPFGYSGSLHGTAVRDAVLRRLLQTNPHLSHDDGLAQLARICSGSPEVCLNGPQGLIAASELLVASLSFELYCQQNPRHWYSGGSSNYANVFVIVFGQRGGQPVATPPQAAINLWTHYVPDDPVPQLS